MKRGAPTNIEQRPYGVVIRPDGTTAALYDSVGIDDVEAHVGTNLVDVARVRPDLADDRPIMMFVDDNGHAKGLPVNPLATMLYGTGWPILGTAIMFDDRDVPLPRSLAEALNTEPEQSPTIRTHAIDTAPTVCPGPMPDADIDDGMDPS